MSTPVASSLALVTGASRGIGRAVARELAAQGSDVVLVARDGTDLDRTAEQVRAETGRAAHTISADLSRAEDVHRVASAVAEQHGRLDVLVNNAGATAPGDLFTVSDDDWDAGIALKLLGYARTCRALWPLLATGGGAVVNVIGLAARRPSSGFVIGGAVNAAVANLTATLAATGRAAGIRVNGVHPGPVLTERYRQLRSAETRSERTDRDFAITAEECARVIAFLASPAASRINGEIVTVDAGLAWSG